MTAQGSLLITQGDVAGIGPEVVARAFLYGAPNGPPVVVGDVGVMRRAVMEVLKSSGYAVHQKGVTLEDVMQADAVFVTNAIEGIRWVQQVGETEYGHGVLKKLHHDLFTTLYTS